MGFFFNGSIYFTTFIRVCKPHSAVVFSICLFFFSFAVILQFKFWGSHIRYLENNLNLASFCLHMCVK